MYGYIYKTTNSFTGEVYIGQKKSNNFNLNYYGSGNKIKERVKEYGKSFFTVTPLCTCESQQELDMMERKFIKKYKKKYGNACINQSSGGQTGTNAFEYADEATKNGFREKMTKINQERCSTEDFKEAARTRMLERMHDPKILEEHRKKINAAWANQELRDRQSKILKDYWKDKERKPTHQKKCELTLNGKTVQFQSVTELTNYLKSELNFTPSHPAVHKMLETGESYKPYHNRDHLLALEGMTMRFIPN